MHAIAHHCLDVAACASILLRNFPSPVAVPPSALVALITCHDIGKFSRTFQAKNESLWPASLGPYRTPPAGYPHDDTGFLLLSGPLADRLAPLFATWRTESARAPLLRAIAGHHGRPPCEDYPDLPPLVAGPICIANARAFLDTAFAVIAPPPLPPLAASERNRLAWFLAGLVVAADWIGSARRWFPLVRATECADLALYFRETALPQAERAVSACGLVPCPVAQITALRSLFPAIDTPRPLQTWAASVALPGGPALFVIEDATGAGKTEAAVLLAHRLMASGRADGLFFALPTMATANAMYDRLAAAYERMFAPGARRPSLVLAHGRRALNPHFTESILDGASEPGTMPPEPADQNAGAQCTAWIADDRRKV
ncbi:MAG: CRISPR-associated endonuclease Cas3'', partial [Acetobacteraceae bacterium]